MAVSKRGVLALWALALCIAAAVLLAAPSPAFASGAWRYDPEGKTLTSTEDGAVVLENVTLDPDGGISIGDNTGSGISELDLSGGVEGPDGEFYSVSSIGDMAFLDCLSLKSVVLPEGLESIGDRAFYSCSFLKSIVFPEGLESIGNMAFSDCTSLESVVLPEGLTSIGDDAFSSCISLKSVVLPEGLKSIGSSAFFYCTSLESVVLPSSLKSIGNDAFYQCTSLTRVESLAEDPPTLYGTVFGECSSIREVVVPAAGVDDYAAEWAAPAQALKIVGGYALKVDGARLPGLFPAGDEVALPEGTAAGAGQHVRWDLSSEAAGWSATAFGDSVAITMPEGDVAASRTVEAHAFGPWEDAGDGTHSRACGCGASETEAHSFSGGRCAACGAAEPGYVPPAVVVPAYAVDVVADGGGSAWADPSKAQAGARVTVACRPDEGREVRSVSVRDRDGDPVEAVEGADGTLSFRMPAGGAVVEVSFGCDGGALCPSAGFSDVDGSAWYHDAVDLAVSSGLMLGYGDGSGLFGPDDPLSRAQAAAVLWRAAGEPPSEAGCGMADVAPGSWCEPAVAWAVSSGLVLGYGDGSGLFGPDDPMTREQLAAVLWRAAGEPDAGAFDGSAFADGAEASEWAGPALAWAVETGVLRGSDDGSGGTLLRPTAAVTRAEMAAMMERQLEAE